MTAAIKRAKMFNIFKNIFSSPEVEQNSCLTTDLHSHLLPGIDDGVESMEEAISLIRSFQELGYKKLVTTPHVMHDFYRNEPETILCLAEELRVKLAELNIDMELEAAAEYYLDEGLVEKVEKGHQLLTFGNNYLLFETSFIDKPMYLDDFIFTCTSKGLNPILAHPERYAYVHNNPNILEELRTRGVFLQVNANSIGGYYSKGVRKMARKMIEDGLVNFIGSDCHSAKHMTVLKETISDPYFRKACDLPLLNSTC